VRVVNANQKLLSVGWTIVKMQPRQHTASFFVKAVFRLKPGGTAEPFADKPELAVADLYQDDDPAKALLYPSDFSPFKPRADLILHATAHAPGQKPAARFNVNWKVGGFEKPLTITGDRKLEKGLVRSKPGAPEPFLSMPLTYERAWGGPKNPRNPVGRSGGDTGFPNIENPRTAESMRADVDPGGYGPIHPTWHQRASQLGTYDQKWLKERWPCFPADFDFGYFNAAPADQQLQGYLQGDEGMVFENLHPEHALYRCRLPGLCARIFLNERAGFAADPNEFREVPLHLDTLWIDLNQEKAILLWRGIGRVRTVKMREVENVFVMTEPLGAGKRSNPACLAAMVACIETEEAEFDIPDMPEEDIGALVDQQMAGLDAEVAEAEKGFAELEAAAAAEEAEARAAAISQGMPPELFDQPPAVMDASQLQAQLAELREKRPDLAAEFEADLAENARIEQEMAAMDQEAAQFEIPDEPPPSRESVVALASLVGADLSKLDLSGLDLSGKDFSKADLSKANLAGAKLVKAKLIDADLSGADLRGADLTGAVVTGASFYQAKLAGAKLAGLSLADADFSKLELAGADFSTSFGANADFSWSNLKGAKFVACQLPAADFDGCNLEEADFRQADLSAADIARAKARKINCEGAVLTDLKAGTGTDFQEGNFKGVQGLGSIWERCLLDRADFSRALLTGAQFPEASLKKAKLDRAQVGKANFEDANLQQAVVTNANLLRSSFERADLTDARLTGSNLYEAGFLDAVTTRTNFQNANLKHTLLS
jgi:uncharacterized protein YjbI with pentapeptide repeats